MSPTIQNISEWWLFHFVSNLYHENSQLTSIGHIFSDDIFKKKNLKKNKQIEKKKRQLYLQRKQLNNY